MEMEVIIFTVFISMFLQGDAGAPGKSPEMKVEYMILEFHL